MESSTSNYKDDRLTKEARGRLMWQLNQMTCPTRTAASHIPFIKAQLKLLYDVARKTVNFYDGKVPEASIALYKTHLKNIFRDKIVSFTSLNIKSVQCAILFTKIFTDTASPEVTRQLLDSGLDDKLFEFYSEKDWDTYAKFLTLTDDHMELPYTVFTDEDGHCIPNCKNKAIIVLLGEMTLFELLWSLSNDLYFVGLPAQIQFADGNLHTPTTFLEHDLGHMTARLDNRPEALRNQENANVKKCLLYINDKSKEIQDAVLLFLFLYMHLEVQGDNEALLVSHTADSGLFRPNNPHKWYREDVIRRLKSRSDLGGFLPEGLAITDAALEAWLRGQWAIFIEYWNASLREEAREIENVGPSSNTQARYLAKTVRNADKWNSSRRRSSPHSGGYKRKTIRQKK
jgi:hypothetical protein